MAEGIAFDLVTGVLGKLGSALLDEIGLLWSFKGDAKDLERQLKNIKAVLLDAEERSSVEIEGTHALRIWLSELKGACGRRQQHRPSQLHRGFASRGHRERIPTHAPSSSSSRSPCSLECFSDDPQALPTAHPDPVRVLHLPHVPLPLSARDRRRRTRAPP